MKSLSGAPATTKDLAFTAAARSRQLAGIRPATFTCPATVRPTEDLPMPRSSSRGCSFHIRGQHN
jgi:hypothetical protein